MKKTIEIFLTILCLAVQVFGLVYLLNGSAEMFPTEERQEAVRITAILLIVFPLFVELFLWRRMKTD